MRGPIFRISALTLLAVTSGVCVSAADEPLRLSLADALSLFLANNPELAEAQSRMDEAEARLRAVRAGAWPTLRVRGGLDAWSEDQRLYPATRNAEPGVFGSSLVSAELVAAVPLYTGGRLAGERDAASWNLLAREERAARVREALAFRVEALFNRLLAQDEVIRSLEMAVQAMDGHRQTIEALLEAEKAARVDLLRVNVRRAELYERQVRETHARSVLQRAWASLLGLDDAVAPEAIGSLRLQPPVMCDDAAVCMRLAFDRRNDYHAAKAEVSATEASVRAARAGRRPTVVAQAAYGTRWMPGPTERPDAADDRMDAGRVGVVLDWPFFDGRLTDAKVAEQSARLRGARERLRAQELQIRFEVETSLSDIAAASERVRTSEAAIGQARESFRIVTEMFDLGRSTLTDVLDAQTALITTETGHVGALADLATAKARHRLATGESMP